MSHDDSSNAMERSVPHQGVLGKSRTFNGKHHSQFLMRRAEKNPRGGFQDPIASVPPKPLLLFPFQTTRRGPLPPTFFVSDCGKIDLLRYGTTAQTNRSARMAFNIARECAHAATGILKNGNVCALMLRSIRGFDGWERRNVRATSPLQVMSNTG